MEPTTKTIKDFMTETGTTIRTEQVYARPDTDSFNGNHYKVKVLRGGKSYTCYYSEGFGIKDGPNHENIMYSLASVACDFESFSDMGEMATEYGYDRFDQYKEVARIWKGVEKANKAMHRLYSDDELEELYRIEY